MKKSFLILLAVSITTSLFAQTKDKTTKEADISDFLIKQAEKQTELKKYIAITEKQVKKRVLLRYYLLITKMMITKTLKNNECKLYLYIFNESKF